MLQIQVQELKKKGKNTYSFHLRTKSEGKHLECDKSIDRDGTSLCSFNNERTWRKSPSFGKSEWKDSVQNANAN